MTADGLRALAIAEKLAQKAAPDKGTTSLAGMVIEPKYDGWRILVYRHEKGVTLYTRTGNTVTGPLPAIRAELERLPVGTWLDCEAVADDQDGGWNTVQRILSRYGAHPLTRTIRFMAFDLLMLGGHDLRTKPLSFRREWLERAVSDCGIASPVLVVDQQPATMALAAEHLAAGWEGSVVKSPKARYASGATGHGWTKLKPQETRDVVVMGFKPGKGGFTGLVGAIVYGAYNAAGELEQLGTCAGFKMPMRRDMTTHPERYLGRPFELAHHSLAGDDRHPQWKRWRDDKPAAECVLVAA